MVHISSFVLTTPINFISTISIADFLGVLLPFYNPSSGSLRLLLLLLLPSLPTPLRAILGIWKAAFCNYTTPGSSSRLATRQPLRPMFSRPRYALLRKMPRSHFNLNNQINQTPQTLLIPQCKTWDQLPGCRFCIQTCRHQNLWFYHFRISMWCALNRYWHFIEYGKLYM